MAKAAFLKNREIIISRPRFDRFLRHLARWRKTGNKTANINVQKLQFLRKIHKKAILTTLTLTFRRC